MLQDFLKMYSSRFDIEPKPGIELYHAYENWARRIVPAENLLEFNPALGWGASLRVSRERYAVK
jgi:hypothetical protein